MLFRSFHVPQAEPEPISIYHPTAEEISASMGTPMEGFFNGVDVVFEATTSATPATTQGVPAETSIPSTKSVPIDEGTHTERVSEAALILAETLTPQEEAIPPIIAQTEITSLATPLVISTNDPFAALSQAVKDGSSLVVILSSIPSSATRGPDADLSSERFEDVLEDPDDEPTMKKRIFDFDEEESADHEAEFMGMHLPYLVKFPSLSLFFFFFIAFLFLLLLIYIHTHTHTHTHTHLHNPLMWSSLYFAYLLL